MKNIRSIALGALAASLSLAAAGTIPSFEKAVPVWPSGAETEMNSFFGFRSSFNAKGGERAILRVTGCSDYRISINGRHAGWGPARAAKGYFRVDEILLEAKEGKNVVAVEVAGYNCLNYCHMKQPPFLQAEVVLNGSVVAHTGKDGTFEAQRLPRLQKVVRYSFQRTFSEAYRLEPGFDDWKQGKGKFSAVPISVCPSVKLLPRRAPYADFRVNGPFKPVSIAKTSFDATRKTLPIRFVDFDGKSATDNGFAKNELEVNWWEDLQRIVPSARVPAGAAMKSRKTFRLAEGDSAIFDAGINDTGFLGLRVRCVKPGTVVVKFDEILVDGEVSPTRYGCANVVAWEFLEPGEYDVEAFEPYTLKYADVIAFKGDFEVSAPYVRTYKNPMAWRARFESSDRSLVQIFNAARETYAQNAADVFTDCPGRERAGWLCDSFFTGRSSLLFTGSLESEHLFLENYALAEGFENLPDGMFAMCYPADFRTGNFIPNWAMWLVLEVEEFRNRGGDAALVEALRPKLVRLVEYLKTFRNADGLLEKLPKWVFIEWSRANSLVQDVNYPSNMAWAEVLDSMDRLYSMPDLAKEAARVRETVRRQSWTGKWFCDNAVRQKDGSLKLSGECTETCQYYAFYFRTATPKSHPELWNTLVEDFGPKRKETGKHPEIWPSNAFIGNYLRLECLAREGLSAQILDETRDFFLYMANLTGTLWENIGTTRSCNHGFASHVAVSYCRDILGLRKIDYRNRVVEFAPPEELPIESVSMEIPVEGGTIRAGWSRKKGKIAREIKLPSGWKLSGKAVTLDPLTARWTFGAHEPYTMYRRVGRHCTGGIDGNAQWVQEWLDWFDAEAPAKMQEAGLNFIHSRFYKGMGWEVEKRDFPNVKRFVANCHAHGVKTLAYVQFNTLYPEAMRREIPDIDSWASVDADGRKNEYNCIWDDRQYFRWSPCLHCREWVEYLKRVCTIALTEGGFDGIMFDNLIDYPCYCTRC